jgi:hypothetical protein
VTNRRSSRDRGSNLRHLRGRQRPKTLSHPLRLLVKMVDIGCISRGFRYTKTSTYAAVSSDLPSTGIRPCGSTLPRRRPSPSRPSRRETEAFQTGRPPWRRRRRPRSPSPRPARARWSPGRERSFERQTCPCASRRTWARASRAGAEFTK